jgi:hypothetical protein
MHAELGTFPSMHKNAVVKFKICNMMQIMAMKPSHVMNPRQATPLGDFHEPSQHR